MPNKLRDELRVLASEIVDKRRPAYTLRDEVLAMKAIFEEAGGQTFGHSDLADGETSTSYGVAISPQMAAMCVDDYARTVQFIRGVHNAILYSKQILNDDRVVRVLYAGSGPWATLATPLMAVLSAEEVKFTLMDLHSESLDSIARLVEALGFEDHVHKLVLADAARYGIDESTAPDILVVEMLRAAMESEPQVAVARNLFQQAPRALMVPQEIRIDLALVNASREFSLDGEGGAVRDRAILGPVFVLNTSKLATAPQTIEIPQFDETRYRLMLLTTIQVYGPHYLRDYDSGITLPKALPRDLNVRPGDRVIFDYEAGPRPQLTARILKN